MGSEISLSKSPASPRQFAQLRECLSVLPEPLCRPGVRCRPDERAVRTTVKRCSGSHKRSTVLGNVTLALGPDFDWGRYLAGDRIRGRDLGNGRGKNEFGISQLLIFGLRFSFSSERLAFKPWPALPLSTLCFHGDVIGAFLLSCCHRRGRLLLSLVPTAM